MMETRSESRPASTIFLMPSVQPALEFMLIWPFFVFARMSWMPAAMLSAASDGSPSQPWPKLTMPSGATERW